MKTDWRKLVVTICGVVALGGCTDPEQAALALYDEAATARDAGRLAESDLLLEAMLAELPETGVTERAESLLEDVRSESERRVFEIMDEIREAQEGFMGRERRHAQSFDELVAGLMLGDAPNGDIIGYRIRTRSSPAADAYSISAEAIVAVESRRSFFQDFDGVMRWNLGGAAAADSPVLQ